MPIELPRASPRASVSLPSACLVFVIFNIAVALIVLGGEWAQLMPKSMFDSRGTRDFEALHEERSIP